ncbi:MAG: glycosyltransferase family 4 protein [Phycisphaerae bacterium]|nr:glycosyltransferase family 4 protein [Phycisphaerae bacterium]
MHILHVEKMLFSPSGVTSTVCALAAWQRARGHRVSMFGCTRDPEQADRPAFRDFTATRNPLALWPMIHNARAAALLDSFLGRIERVDVAHVHNLYHHLTPSVLPVLARHRAAIVMTVHDYRLACPAKHFLRPDGVCMRCWPHALVHAASPRCLGPGGVALAIETLVQRFFRRYVRWVEKFLCPSAFMAEVMHAVGVPRGRLAVVPNLIERPELASGERRRAKRFVYAGRLTAEKGPDLMLELAERLPAAEVVIAGDGRLREQLEARARRRGLTHVTFLGALERAALARLYASATAVVVPSRCMENSPQTMLEAMACGRVVIVPDHPTLRQWVTDGRTGRVFAPGNSESLAAVAEQVLADRRRRQDMERRAMELVNRRHDAEAIGTRTDELYEEARRRCALRW